MASHSYWVTSHQSVKFPWAHGIANVGCWKNIIDMAWEAGAAPEKPRVEPVVGKEPRAFRKGGSVGAGATWKAVIREWVCIRV